MNNPLRILQTLDLILTKMARGDENDLGDIRFLLQQEPLTAEQLSAAFQLGRVPDAPEIQELFRASQLNPPPPPPDRPGVRLVSTPGLPKTGAN